MPDKCVVTGGAGFIGSHIVDRLISEGYEVCIVDNLLTGKKFNIQHLLGNDLITFYRNSITDLDALRSIFEGAKYVFHQAALPSVPRSVSDPLTTHLHCVTGTLNVLQAARDAGVKRVIYASSSAVYGDAENSYKTENMPPRPKSPYGAAKLAAEYYCRVFTENYGLETVSLRYFNVFGPRQDPGSEYAAVIPKFTTLMRDGHAPIIYGDGRQSRDFTYVDNVVTGNILAAKAPEAVGKVFNLAAGGQVEILDLVDKLNKLLNTTHQPIHAQERLGDIKHSCANVDRAREVLGYEPVVDFDAGLACTVAWFINQVAS